MIIELSTEDVFRISLALEQKASSTKICDIKSNYQKLSDRLLDELKKQMDTQTNKTTNQ